VKKKDQNEQNQNPLLRFSFKNKIIGLGRDEEESNFPKIWMNKTKITFYFEDLNEEKNYENIRKNNKRLKTKKWK